eukprot:2663193-Alexandrium_andersonii.AAC.2
MATSSAAGRGRMRGNAGSWQPRSERPPKAQCPLLRADPSTSGTTTASGATERGRLRGNAGSWHLTRGRPPAAREHSSALDRPR